MLTRVSIKLGETAILVETSKAAWAYGGIGRHAGFKYLPSGESSSLSMPIRSVSTDLRLKLPLAQGRSL